MVQSFGSAQSDDCRARTPSAADAEDAFKGTLERTVRLTSLVLDMPFVQIDLHTEADQRFSACIDFDQDRTFLGTSISRRIAKTGERVVICDAVGNEDPTRDDLLSALPDIRACIAMPLVWNTSIIGSFVAFDVKHRIFSPRDISMFADFTHLINQLLALAAAVARDETSSVPGDVHLGLSAIPTPPRTLESAHPIDDVSAAGRQQQNILRLTEERLRALTDQMPAMIGYWNSDLRCEFANEAYRGWFKISPDAIVGLHMAELFESRVFSALEPFARAALRGEAQRFERQFPDGDGKLAYVDVQYIVDREREGPIRGFYVLVTDITTLRVAQIELEKVNKALLLQNSTDNLTGLKTRHAFNEKMRDLYAQHEETRVSHGLVLIDVDNFKWINDSYGHLAGDAVLAKLGELLSAASESGDFAARLGGEEFGILTQRFGTEEALSQFAEKLRTAINTATLNTEGNAIHFTASFGVSEASQYTSNNDLDQLFRSADNALYRAKLSGRNCVVRASEVAE